MCYFIHHPTPDPWNKNRNNMRVYKKDRMRLFTDPQFRAYKSFSNIQQRQININSPYIQPICFIPKVYLIDDLLVEYHHPRPV